MTTLYRPVLIESAEQAEALPAGTLARHSEGAGMDHAHKIAAMPGLMGSHWVSSMGVESNAAMIGWTALVPIEVEVETREHPRRHEKAPRAGEAYLRPATMTRLVTPWEEA